MREDNIMLVKNWMGEPAITIEADSYLKDAIWLLKQHRISMCPVMKFGLLVGIVTDRDLKRVSPSDVPSFDMHELVESISRVKVKTVMTQNPVTIPYDYTVEEGAEVLLGHKISGVPVVDQVKKPIGVITKTDLFRALFSLTGISKKGIQFAFQVIDRPGAIRDITDILRDYGGRIASVLSTRGKAKKGFIKVYIHAYGFDPVSRQRVTEVISDKAPPLYMVDHEAKTRTIHQTPKAEYEAS
jgi:acetoin utilization protein AcuB